MKWNGINYEMWGNQKNTIPFKDNKKNVIHLKRDMTIKDLVKMGCSGIRLGKFEPLKDGWWINIEGKESVEN